MDYNQHKSSMKTHFPFLFAFLCLLYACTSKHSSSPDFMQNEFAFPLPVSSLSDGKDCLWIGTKTGSVARFDPETGRYSDPVFIDNGHVYCIREVYDSLLLVGIRNSGLKLVDIKEDNIAEILTQFVLEGHRGINYSPYSFFVKRAEDAAGTTDASVPDTLFCGTSNGLFWLPMPQNCDKLNNREDLIPIYEKYDDPGIKFLSVVLSCGDEVYGGSTEGLFKVGDTDSEKTGERYEILDTTPVTHLSVSGGCLYVLDNKGRVYSSGLKEETVRYDKNIPLAFFSDNGFRFAVTPFNLNISDTEGEHNIFPLNGRSAIGGENNRGRECFLRHGDYYYIAIGHGICRIPVHLNLNSKVHVISAAAGPSADKIYALTEKSGLYRIKRDEKRAKFFRTLSPEKGNAVNGLDGCIGRNLIFHTKDRIYSVRPGFFSKMSMIKDIPDRAADIQQVIVLPDTRIIAAYSDTSFILNCKTREITAMDIGADSYVTAIDYAPDKMTETGYRIWAGTLNKGLYLVDAYSGKCTEISAGDIVFKSVIDLKTTENNVHILMPGKIVRLECKDEEWLVAGTTAVPHDVRSLFISRGNLYTVSVSGGIRPVASVSANGDARTNKLLYPDISFLPDEIRHTDSGGGTSGTSLISENGVIYDWSEDATDNISYAGISVPSCFVRKMSWKGGWGAVIFIVILVIFTLVLTWTTRKLIVISKNVYKILKICQNVYTDFSNQYVKLNELCESGIIPRNILDEYEKATKGNNIQYAASMNESVKNIIKNISPYKHWPKLLDEITANSGREFYASSSIIVENLKHLKYRFDKIKNCKPENMISLSEILSSRIHTFSSDNIHNVIRQIFIDNLKDSGIDTDIYIIGKVIDKISDTTDQLEFLNKCMYNISHIEPLKKLSEVAKFIDDSLNELDGIQTNDKDFLKQKNKNRGDKLNADFGKHAMSLYDKLCPEDKDILKACTLKATKENNVTFLVFLSSINSIKNTSKLPIRYLCKTEITSVEFAKTKSKLREKFKIFSNLNWSDYKYAVIVPVLFETAINYFGKSPKDKNESDSTVRQKVKL